MFNHFKAASSLMLNFSRFYNLDHKYPTVSKNFPSLGERESAATIRYCALNHDVQLPFLILILGTAI